MSNPYGPGCDVVALWPDLFEGMPKADVEGYRQVFAVEYLNGWSPERAAVADLIDVRAGRINFPEYMVRRATAWEQQ